MKGVILAGGTGSRLYPLTKSTNKHLLPVYDKPMIYYPIQAMVNAGIEDILLVVGGNHAGEFLKLLGNGAEFGLKHLNYTYQETAGGIAQALGLARHFVGDERVVVILGDNIIETNFRGAAERFEKQERGARVLLAEVDNPSEYGVAVVKDGRIERIIEKPKEPPSNLAVTGIYFFDNQVFEVVDQLKPSARGELEITDVNNAYIEKGCMEFERLDGWWGDAGESIDALLRVSNLVASTGANKI